MEKKIVIIINRILEKKGLPLIETMKPEHSLRKTYQFDSMDLAELTVRIEDDFGVDIFEEDIVDTLEEILRILRVHQESISNDVLD